MLLSWIKLLTLLLFHISYIHSQYIVASELLILKAELRQR